MKQGGILPAGEINIAAITVDSFGRYDVAEIQDLQSLEEVGGGFNVGCVNFYCPKKATDDGDEE